MSLWGQSFGRRPELASMLPVALVILLLAAGCGGAASSLTNGAGQLAFDNTNETAAGGTVLSSGALPSIPLDDTATVRGASEIGDPPPPEELTVLGSDFVAQWSGEVVQDTALLLDPALQEQGDHPLAFGLYKVADIGGRRPLEMTVEGTVGEGQQYFVGVADYTRGNWQWFGPAEDATFAIDLRSDRHRYVSRAGNMYFLIVAHAGNTVLHAQTRVLVGPAFHDDHPGFPVALRASDGEFPAKIEVEWLAGEGAVNFELFRATPAPPGQRPEWQSLGFTTEESWTDTAIIPDKVYIYKVRAINDAGRSAFSNVDHGFAGEAPPPPPQFEIGGRVVQQGTEIGVPNVVVALLGAPHAPGQPDVLTFTTQQNGEFGFNHLPAGNYIVVPQNPNLEFEPKFMLVRADNEHPHPMLRFEARPAEHTRAVWGIVYTMGGPDNPGLHPLANVPVAVKKLNTQDPPQQVQTGEHGFFMLGQLANGDYDVRPLAPPDGSLQFFPVSRLAHIDGEHMTPGLFFRGQFAQPGGGDGGGGDPN